jgi:hypothetical protein
MEPRRLLAAAIFDAGGDGTSWADPLNWTTDTAPTSADDVTIPAGLAQPVLLAGGSTRTVRSLTVAGTLNVKGVALVSTSGTVIGFDGSVAIDADGQLQPRGSLTLNGQLVVGSAAGRGTVFVDGADSSFVGAGVITIGGAAQASAITFDFPSQTPTRSHTIAAGLTIRCVGRAWITPQVTGDAIVNRAAIQVDGPSADLTLGGSALAPLTNAGAITVTNGAVMQFGGSWSTAANATATSGGRIIVTGVTTGESLDKLRATGSAEVLIRGNVDISPSRPAQIVTQNLFLEDGGVFRGGTVTGSFRVRGGTVWDMALTGVVSVLPGAALFLRSTVIIDGQIAVGQQGDLRTTELRIDNHVALGGRGSVAFYGPGSMAASWNGLTLTIGGDLHVYSLADARIVATATTNLGRIEAMAGGTVTVVGPLLQRGQIVASGGAVDLQDLQGSLGRPQLAAPGSLWVRGAYTLTSAFTIPEGAAVRLGGFAARAATLTVDGTLLVDAPVIDEAVDETPWNAAVVSGYAGGAWNGEGIRSARAAADPDLTLTLIRGNEVPSPRPSFAGLTPGAGTLVIHCGKTGDTDLDGDVDATDAARQSAALNLPTDRYQAVGNLDFDGDVDAQDRAALIARLRPLPAATFAPIPPRTAALPAAQLVTTFPLSGLEAGDFTLRRNDGTPLPLTAATLSGGGTTSLTLGGLSAVTAEVGLYELRLPAVGTGVTDPYGRPLAADAVQTFRVYRVGDMDGDGQVNNLDIAPFVLALTNPTGFASSHPFVDPALGGDANGDGSFNNLDIAAFVGLLTGGPPPAPAVRGAITSAGGTPPRAAEVLVHGVPPGTPTRGRVAELTLT